MIADDRGLGALVIALRDTVLPWALDYHRRAAAVLGERGVFLPDGSDSLDAAWAEAEAALPKGWVVAGLNLDLWALSRGEQVWVAAAGHPLDSSTFAEAPTPAAALRALAAKLREVPR